MNDCTNGIYGFCRTTSSNVLSCSIIRSRLDERNLLLSCNIDCQHQHNQMKTNPINANRAQLFWSLKLNISNNQCSERWINAFKLVIAISVLLYHYLSQLQNNIVLMRCNEQHETNRIEQKKNMMMKNERKTNNTKFWHSVFH